MTRTILIALLLLTTDIVLAFNSALQYPTRTDVWTRSYDSKRSAANWRETVLTSKNVNSEEFGTLFKIQVEGHIYSQVLYIHDAPVRVTGSASGRERWELRNIMFVTTMRNKVFALDADNPMTGEPLWTVDLGNAIPMTDRIFGEKCSVRYNQAMYRDIFGWVGIVSTPVIDRRRHAMFLVALERLDGYTPSEPKVKHFLYRIDIRNGKIVKRVSVDATVKGNGAGSVDGMLALDSLMQLQRSSLALSPDGKHVYFGFGAYCDTMPYHGWVLMYDTSTLQQMNAWCSSPNHGGASVWNSGEAITVYPSGKLLVSTSNTPFDPLEVTYEEFSIDNHSYPVGLVRLDPHKTDNDTGMMHVDSFFIPKDDTEVGLMGTSIQDLRDGTQVTTMGGKNGKLWVVSVKEEDPLPGLYGEPLRMIQFNKHLHGTPVHWWDNESRKDRMFIWPMYESLKHYSYNRGSSMFELENENPRNSTFPGGFLSISGNADNVESTVVWANVPRDVSTMPYSAIHNIVKGTLIAYDPKDVSHVLWSSDMVSREDVGAYCKFNRPVIAAGRVFLPALSDQPYEEGFINVFGLEKPQFVAPPLVYDPEKRPPSIEAVADVFDYERQRQENKWVRLHGAVTGKGPLTCEWHVSERMPTSPTISIPGCTTELELDALREKLGVGTDSQILTMLLEVRNDVATIESEPFQVDLNNLPPPPSLSIPSGSTRLAMSHPLLVMLMAVLIGKLYLS